MSIRTLPSSPPACAIARAGVVLAVLALTACAGQERLPADAEGQLFARGLDEIAGLYIEPVSSRRLALSGAKRLSRLDNQLTVSDDSGAGVADAVELSYGGRDIGLYAKPAKTNSPEWGELVATLIATAKQASPRLAALPPVTIEKAVFDGMTGALDRFSHYSIPAVARDQRAARDGFGGIGVTLDTTGDTFRVTAIAPHSPADRAGIRPEDQIVAIDGVATAGDPHQDVVHRLRGAVGSTVSVRILHPGMAQARDLRLRRAYVVLPTVTMSRDGDVVVFQIASFNHSTTQRLAAGLAEAQRQTNGRLAGIVLDLRGNPGGLLDQAVSLADLFIDRGPIVSTVGRHPASHQYFAATGDTVAPHLPIVVLINGGSASASEIVAASLQDVGRAVVVGSSSYGKGTVQTVLRLPNDGELTVTWARLVTPSGYFLQTHGVVPTVCTAGLGGAPGAGPGDDANALATGLQRVAASVPGAGLTLRPRASLDERAWSALRASCPPRHARPAIDLKLAERMLADPKFYSEALHALPASTRLAQSAPAGGSPDPAVPEPALTQFDRALSSRSR